MGELFACRELTSKAGKKFERLYKCRKPVKQYYIYFRDCLLGGCYLKNLFLPAISVRVLFQWPYRGCDRILIQSEAFRDSVLKYSEESEKIRYFPNCAEDIFQPINVTAEAPERDLMPEGFRVMFAGNIGISQDFETILAAASLTGSQSGIQWVIVGNGRYRPCVEQEIQSRALTNVHLLGRYPKEKMPVFFSLADVMLVRGFR
jgi:colanic acid biosynthesis glycosyl transferase WcaI